MKKKLRSDTFTRDYILDIVKLYPELVRLCYINFATIHYFNPAKENEKPSISFQRIQTTRVLSDEELLAVIKKTVSGPQELMVF